MNDPTRPHFPSPTFAQLHGSITSLYETEGTKKYLIPKVRGHSRNLWVVLVPSCSNDVIVVEPSAVHGCWSRNFCRAVNVVVVVVATLHLVI